MCANYTPPPPRALRELLHAREAAFGYAAEAYPGAEAVMLLAGAASGADAPFEPVAARFGLLPGWARDDKLMRHTYNARSETVAEKPSFRNAWRRRQFCLIPVQAFYEPNYESGLPVRWRIARADGAPFCVAGLWETAWRDAPAPSLDLWSDAAPAQTPARIEIHSFTMLTIAAEGHPLMTRFHAPDDEKRSVVVLHPDDHRAWLHADERRARALLQPFDAHEFVSAPDPRPARANKVTARSPDAPP
jgi:putative SOS response-associated peptidase YedK